MMDWELFFEAKSLESDAFFGVVPAAMNSAPGMTCSTDEIWYDESLSDIVIILFPLSIWPVAIAIVSPPRRGVLFLMANGFGEIN